MSENQYREVDPYAVAVSDMNERRSSPVTSSIQESIEQQGVIQPPLVRERDGMDDAEVPYEAVVGQRRVLGAQAASGVETIPVVVVGWDDAEALEASITENIDAFSEDVSPKDRAEAVIRLMEMRDYNQRQAADTLGVSRKVVEHWIERAREEWEDTSIHPNYDGSEQFPEIDFETSRDDGLDDLSVKRIRQATGGGEKGEKMAAAVVREGLSQHDVAEAKERVSQGAKPEDAVAEVSQEKRQQREVSITQRSNVEFTLSDDEAEALETAAKQRGATENQVARQEIVRYLNREGFL
jgi:ParB/RepB/Spo0J family partition protein